jgi:hypothetical protein
MLIHIPHPLNFHLRVISYINLVFFPAAPPSGRSLCATSYCSYPSRDSSRIRKVQETMVYERTHITGTCFSKFYRMSQQNKTVQSQIKWLHSAEKKSSQETSCYSKLYIWRSNIQSKPTVYQPVIIVTFMMTNSRIEKHELLVGRATCFLVMC